MQSLLEQNNICATVEVHDQPVELISNYDSRDRAVGNIIIRRTDFKGLLDIGFLWNEQLGCFEAQLDAWDFSHNLLGSLFNSVEHFLNLVQLAHDTAYIKIQYPSSLWDYQTTTLEDGSIQTTLTQKVSLTTAGNNWE